MGFKNLNSIEVSEDLNLIDALIKLELVKSKRESREMILNGAVSVNGDKVIDLDFVIKKVAAYGEKYTILRKGKKRYAVIKHK